MKGLRARATAAFRGFNLLGAAPKPRSGAAMPEERIARSPTKPRLSLPSVPIVPRKSLPALQGTARAHWGGAGWGCGFRVDGGGLRLWSSVWSSDRPLGVSGLLLFPLDRFLYFGSSALVCCPLKPGLGAELEMHSPLLLEAESWETEKHGGLQSMGSQSRTLLSD